MYHTKYCAVDTLLNATNAMLQSSQLISRSFQNAIDVASRATAMHSGAAAPGFKAKGTEGKLGVPSGPGGPKRNRYVNKK